MVVSSRKPVMSREEVADFAISLATFLEKRGTVYLTWEGNIDDFTKSFPGRLVIHGREECLKAAIPDHAVLPLSPHFLAQVFGKDRLVICWDVKRLFSYLRFHLPSYYQIRFEAKIIDLKLVEAFAGVEMKRPDSWDEAIARIKP